MTRMPSRRLSWLAEFEPMMFRLPTRLIECRVAVVVAVRPLEPPFGGSMEPRRFVAVLRLVP